MTTQTENVLVASPSVLKESIASRFVSIDVLRGATIAAMILVNNPGNGEAAFAPLHHARWHGWTPTDLVFPFFLFIVGVSIVLAYSRRLSVGTDRGHLTVKALRRSAILFGLGLFLNAFPFIGFDPGSWRIMGVLQRIALCFMAGALLFLYAGPRAQRIWMWNLLLIYWAAMTLVPVPGVGSAGNLDTAHLTLQAWLDQLIVGRSHLYRGADNLWDPEGILSTLPAISTVLFGMMTGYLLKDERPPLEKTASLLLRGFGLVVLGYVWDWFFPINKSIWTSSYTVFTAGLAMLMLGACYWFIDVRQKQSWTKPFVIFGMNAIAVYFLAGILADLLYAIPVGATSLREVLYTTFFDPIGLPGVASLLWSVLFVAVIFGFAWLLYWRRIFIRV